MIIGDNFDGEAVPTRSDATSVPSRSSLGDLADDLGEYAIFPLDVAGRISGWNEGAEHVHRYEGERIIGRHLSVFYPPERVAAGYPEWELAQASREGFWVDHGWRVRGDGSWFWTHVIITAQRSPLGQLEGFIKITRDASRSQARQQRASQRFTDLFDASPSGLAIVDKQGHVLDVNPALVHLLGSSRDALCGHPATALLSRDDQDTPLPATDQPAGQLTSAWQTRHLQTTTAEPVICEVASAVSTQDDGNRLRMLVFHNITAQHHEQHRLRYQAAHDELTGLLNRTGFTDALDRLLSDTNGQTAVLFCDLDDFKRVNDSLGHHAGDELLVALARHLQTELPADCVPARFSGDEFLIACPNVAAHGGVEAMTARIAALVRTRLPVHQQFIHVSAAVGAAVVSDEASTGPDLLRAADVAMLEAKSRGAGHAAVAEPRLVNAAADQLHLETDLRHALSQNQLVLHYQPIFNNEHEVEMVEALLRWPHPEHGTLAPDVVLSVAHRAGLLGELEQWILHTALTEAATWPVTVHTTALAITVNINDPLTHQPHFVTDTLQTLQDNAIHPERLILEVTESSLISQPEKSRHAMDELITHGVRFAVDDFGTGYSSLARLKAFPTQLVKLAKQFVAGIATNPGDHAICRTAINLATAMHRDCIAEGIETHTQHELLIELGYTYHQGFLLAHPMPAHQLHQLLT